MSCNPLDKCCEVTPSTCVVYTGDLQTNTYLYVEDSSLNSLVSEIDLNILGLTNAARISIQDLKDADTCNWLDLTGIVYRDRKTTRTDYVQVSDIVKQLVKNECILQGRLNFIYTELADPLNPSKKGQLTQDFLNLELPQGFKDSIACLNCDNGCDTKYPTTLGSLLEILVGKIIAYEKTNAKLNCADCQCIDC